VTAVLVLIAALSAGCQKGAGSQGIDKAGKISIVCTTFPQYDWVRHIAGERTDHFSLNLLLDNRIDLHNYQPSADDIAMISECSLFIYVGGESDGWAADVLKSTDNPDRIVINLLDVLGDSVIQEENKEGMADDSYGHGQDNESHTADEHVWLSLANAEIFCGVIADALIALDGANATEYTGNLAEYRSKLTGLDAEYRMATNEAPVKTLLFGDRFPFRYLAEDYGLDYYAAFTGCSAEAEASFETIVFLSEKITELGLNAVMVTEGSDQSIAKTILDNAPAEDQKILALDSMQSVSSGDLQNGVTYLSIMESNLGVLKEALS
jgi:zinc transport system substrate-binding protein